ncbi:MAG: ribosome recycling factor [Candidatus Cloacimonas sp. 4484_209]|nr:MAG: ribosome recycling factor [Candidatus Cloacimonas sp. 4484_209]
MNVEEIKKMGREKMQKSVDAVRNEIIRIRTGKATTALLEGIKVEAYGSKVPLKQIANIGVPEPRLLLIQPWDKNILPNIEKAIFQSELGLTPNNDGRVIRLPIPPLTEERRKELVKLVKKLGEEGKIAIRNIRRECNDDLKKAEKSGGISEDESKRVMKEIQDITDEFISKIDEIIESKEKEILEI